MHIIRERLNCAMVYRVQ